MDLEGRTVPWVFFIIYIRQPGTDRWRVGVEPSSVTGFGPVKFRGVLGPTIALGEGQGRKDAELATVHVLVDSHPDGDRKRALQEVRRQADAAFLAEFPRAVLE